MAKGCIVTKDYQAVTQELIEDMEGGAAHD